MAPPVKLGPWGTSHPALRGAADGINHIIDAVNSLSASPAGGMRITSGPMGTATRTTPLGVGDNALVVIKSKAKSTANMSPSNQGLPQYFDGWIYRPSYSWTGDPPYLQASYPAIGTLITTDTNCLVTPLDHSAWQSSESGGEPTGSAIADSYPVASGHVVGFDVSPAGAAVPVIAVSGHCPADTADLTVVTLTDANGAEYSPMTGTSSSTGFIRNPYTLVNGAQRNPSYDYFNGQTPPNWDAGYLFFSAGRQAQVTNAAQAVINFSPNDSSVSIAGLPSGSTAPTVQFGTSISGSNNGGPGVLGSTIDSTSGCLLIRAPSPSWSGDISITVTGPSGSTVWLWAMMLLFRRPAFGPANIPTTAVL